MQTVGAGDDPPGPLPGRLELLAVGEAVGEGRDGLGATQPLDKLATLDKAFHFTGTPNGEIAMRWYPLAIRSGYEQANEGAAAFIERVGRRKLIMPIYEELVKTPDGLAFAHEVFARARPGYHPITTGSVQKVIDEARPQAPASAARRRPPGCGRGRG